MPQKCPRHLLSNRSGNIELFQAHSTSRVRKVDFTTRCHAEADDIAWSEETGASDRICVATADFRNKRLQLSAIHVCGMANSVS
jgi:hypothetical protein